MLFAVRLLLDACGVAAVGLAVLPWLVAPGQRRGVDAVRAASVTAAVVVAGGWAATALVALWLQAAEVAGRSATTVGAGTVADYVTGFGAGAGLLVTVACAVTIGLGSSVGRLPPGLFAVVAVLGVLPAPITGHAAQVVLAELAVVAVGVHAVAAAAWVGGLGALFVIGPRRALLAVALPRFSLLAGWCLAGLAASGVLTAVAVLDSVPALVTTGYGLVVSAKAVVLIGIALVGLVIRQRILPRALAHRRVRWRRLAGVELSLMTVALGLAAGLTRLAP